VAEYRPTTAFLSSEGDVEEESDLVVDEATSQ
jgi:hypothetical protein